MRCSWPIFMGGREDCGYDHSWSRPRQAWEGPGWGAWPLSVPQRYGQDVSVLLSVAAGMMLAVVCADLLTDAIQAGPGLSALPAASASVLAGWAGDLAAWRSW
mgnify:CR=1 FL=1